MYVPGSGGVMLYKILTLSEKTITGTNGRDLNEYKTELTAQEKFNQYCSWDHTDWKNKEISHSLSFKEGLVDFHHYEQSDLWLIDHWHPEEFYNLYQQKNLWGKDFYPTVIFIDVMPEHREFIENNQSKKVYNANFNQEYYHLGLLQHMFNDISITVPFDCFFNEPKFLQQIEYLDSELELNLNFDLVKDLYKNWIHESLLVWKL